METVYLLVKCERGREVEVVKEFEALNKLQTVCAVTGPYDYLLKLEGENMKDIGDTIIRRIRQIHGVNDTLTLVVLDTHL